LRVSRKRQDGFASNFFQDLGVNTCSVQPALKSKYPAFNTLSGVMSERCPSPQLCSKAHTIKAATARGESLATCGRFDRLGIWTSYLPHLKRTSYHLCYLAGIKKVFT